ncbi:MAG: hypothetical protein U1D98_04780 [Candidatus Gracilibacteria bacterium]|nr:hypothetical protein [Candidatus Gracilibacteria bacterium]
MKTQKNKTQAAQVYFPKSVYFKIKIEAKREDKPMAAWIRDIVLKELEKKNKGKKRLSDLKTFSVPEFKGFKPEDIDKIVYELGYLQIHLFG